MRPKSALSAALDDFDNLSQEQQQELLTSLSEHYCKPSEDNYCERLHCTLTKPCTLDECPLHCDNHQFMNCAGLYKDREGNPDLNLHQLAGITGDTEHGVRIRLAATLTKIRREALRQNLLQTTINRFQYLPGTKVCIYCGSLITRQVMNPQLAYKDFQWCCRDCKAAKPEWIIDAERCYGTDILTIMYNLHKMFKKILPIALILRARKKVLLAMYSEHFHIPPASFGIEAMDAVDILRNSTPLNTWGFGTLTSDRIQHPKLRKVLDKVDRLIKTL